MKILFFSDTHGEHEQLKTFASDKSKNLKNFIAIHGGDITENGTEFETLDFLQWFARLPCLYKIFIAGNHDFFLESCSSKELKKIIPPNLIYLNNNSVIVNGYRFWGSAYSPYFLGMAFNKHRGDELKNVWKKIPLETDVLITHTPPFGILDNGYGCEDLKTKIEKVNPRLHLFGHIHEQKGMIKEGATTYVNAALANNKNLMDINPHKMIGEPIVLDIGIGKQNFKTS